jgi:hypothetical protein
MMPQHPLQVHLAGHRPAGRGRVERVALDPLAVDVEAGAIELSPGFTVSVMATPMPEVKVIAFSIRQMK